jgi:integrase
MGLGPYPEVSLAVARETASSYRQQIRDGLDPLQERRDAKNALRVERAKQLTFEEAALRVHEIKKQEFRNGKHKNDWINALKRHAFPIIGKMPVQQIERSHIMQILEPIWLTKSETATRVRQRLETVLTWTIINDFRTGDNVATWKGNLEGSLPKARKVAKRKNFTSVPVSEMPEFMAKLRAVDKIDAKALEFLILTAARTAEVRKLPWDEIDSQEALWTVPGDRIKAGKTHRVPLSEAAMSVLSGVPEHDGKDFVFVSVLGGIINENAMLNLVSQLGYKATVHGFRSTFKDWARTKTSYPDEVSELALAHVSSDETRAAYARDELLDKRRGMMEDWADFLL